LRASRIACGLKVVCAEAVTSGKYDVDGKTPQIKAVEDVVWTFKGCGIPAVGSLCHAAGQEEIVTNALEGNLGYISKAVPAEVGVELHPQTKGGAVLEFECTSSFRIVVKECNAGAAVCGPEEKGGNCIISRLTPILTMSTTGFDTYKVVEHAPGVQAPQHFENLKPPLCNLENTTNGEQNERSTWNLVGEILDEQPLEIFA
jgi:hypothetical protein